MQQLQLLSFFGLLLTLSSSVYRRLLPPADLPGSSKDVVVPHLHTTWAHTGKHLVYATQCSGTVLRQFCLDYGKFSLVAEVEKALSSLFLGPGVESVSKAPSTSRNQGLPGRKGRPPLNDETCMGF